MKNKMDKNKFIRIFKSFEKIYSQRKVLNKINANYFNFILKFFYREKQNIMKKNLNTFFIFLLKIEKLLILNNKNKFSLIFIKGKYSYFWLLKKFFLELNNYDLN